MDILTFKVNLKTSFTDAQLVKSGWEVKEKDQLYIRIKGKYKYSYNIKNFGKIRISNMKAEVHTEQPLSIGNFPEFNFEDAWKNLWNKSFIPESIEMITKSNIFEKLVDNGWKPAVLGVIEYVSDENNLSYYYPAPEGEGLYKLVDDNPGDVIKFIDKLKALNII
jgi:hypothetical protein